MTPSRTWPKGWEGALADRLRARLLAERTAGPDRDTDAVRLPLPGEENGGLVLTWRADGSWSLAWFSADYERMRYVEGLGGMTRGALAWMVRELLT